MSPVAVDAFGGDLDFADATEREQKFYEVLGRLFRSLFDDVTERLDLERRFDALISVQRETLDNLSEGVAVFGSDGRLRLYNPVFAHMWQLAPSKLAERPHLRSRIQSDSETKMLNDAINALSTPNARAQQIQDQLPDGWWKQVPWKNARAFAAGLNAFST